MRFLCTLPLALAILITCESSASTINEVLTSAAQAVSKLQSISYHVAFRQDVGKSDASFSITGDVTLDHASTYLGFPARFRIDGVLNNPGLLQPSKFSLAFTGPTLRIIDFSNKTYFDAPSTEDAPAYHLGTALLEPYFINGSAPALPQPRSGVSATLGSSEEVNGVTCHHVIIKQKLDPDPSITDGADAASPEPLYTTIHEYFATSDFLLRKRITEMPSLSSDPSGKNSLITVTFTITDINTNPTIDDKTFAPEIPEGYLPQKPADLDTLHVDSKLQVGDIAPDWDAKDPDGNTHTLSHYKDKVVLMDFWATWCAPCKAAMPGIQKLYDKFKDKDFLAFGLSVNDQGDPAAYMKSKNYTYTCLLNGENVSGPYGVSALPQFFLIGKDGRIIFHSAGFDEKQEEKLTAIIQSALDAK